jgi:hypothetical protein
VLGEYNSRLETYEALTGEPWNVFPRIVLNDQHQNRKSMLWVSQDAIASVVVKNREYATVDVILDELFDSQHDYLIREDRTPPQFAGQKERWQLTLLAGTMPRWAYFGWAWARWVRDPVLQQSALEHITTVVPRVQAAVIETATISQTHLRGQAWKEVADTVSGVLKLSDRDRNWLLRLPDKTSTAVEALPMRIAQQIGWTPPRPMPDFEKPEGSGRILLADHRGETTLAEVYEYEEEEIRK